MGHHTGRLPMPPTPPPRRGIDPADLHAEAQVNATLHLPARTLDWLAKDSRARSVVHSVWDTLAELERSGQYPGAINSLRRVLTQHQPTSAGRCRTCRRWGWRRRFPCVVWHQIRGELLGLFPEGGSTDGCDR